MSICPAGPLYDETCQRSTEREQEGEDDLMLHQLTQFSPQRGLSDTPIIQPLSGAMAVDGPDQSGDWMLALWSVGRTGRYRW